MLKLAMCENEFCRMNRKKLSLLAVLYKIAKMRQELFIFRRRLGMTQLECSERMRREKGEER
jgi:division protein CdvB (Snf7/Vps24/ESCRT-III family)